MIFGFFFGSRESLPPPRIFRCVSQSEAQRGYRRRGGGLFTVELGMLSPSFACKQPPKIGFSLTRSKPLDLSLFAFLLSSRPLLVAFFSALAKLAPVCLTQMHEVRSGRVKSLSTPPMGTIYVTINLFDGAPFVCILRYANSKT